MVIYHVTSDDHITDPNVNTYRLWVIILFTKKICKETFVFNLRHS